MESTCATPKKRFIESSSFYKNDCANPFLEMKIQDTGFLENVPQRSFCPKCFKSRKYYCYTCYVAVKEISNMVPVVKLPVQVDIIKHPKEVDGKSTSAHAAVLAPEDVKIYTYPDIPIYDEKKVLLIFPGKNAVTFKEWWASNVNNVLAVENKESRSNHLCDENEVFNAQSDSCMYKSAKQEKLPFEKVIFIDSTWRQSRALYSDPQIQRLPCVVLSSYKSVFWRYYRGKHETYLSTIEAVYYFLIELHKLLHPNVPYCGEYDNMLFFFKFMYFKIRTLYDPAKLKAYQQTN